MNDPVKQHTVPCSYLKGFSDNPKGRDSIVYSYDIKEEKGFYAPVSKITIEKDIYTLIDKNGDKSYFVEDFLGKNIDNISDIIEKIDKREILATNELEKLALFIVFQEMRTKSRMEHSMDGNSKLLNLLLRGCFENYKTQSELKQFIQNTLTIHFPGSKLECSIEELIIKLKNGDEIPLNTKNVAIKNMIGLAPEMQKFLLLRPWFIFQAPKGKAFITSDYPLYLDGKRDAIYGVGYGTADAIHMPLSKKSFLIMDSPGNDVLDFKGQSPSKVKNIYSDLASPEFIRLRNYTSAHGTTRRLIGNSDKLVKRIHKTIKRMDEEYKLKRKKSIIGKY